MENLNKHLANTSIHTLPSQEENQKTSTPRKDNLSTPIPTTTTITSDKTAIKNIINPPTSKSTSTSPPLPNSHLNETTNKETPPTKREHKTSTSEEINPKTPRIKITPPTPPRPPLLPPQPASAWNVSPNSTDCPNSHDSILSLMSARKPPSPLPSSQCLQPGKPSLKSKSKETISTTATITKDGDRDGDGDEIAGLKVEVKKEVGFAPYVDVIHYPVLDWVVSGEEGKKEERKKEEEVKAKNVLRKIGGWMRSFF